MADEQQDPAPAPAPVTQAAPVDQGLMDWGNLVHSHLSVQNGVEVTARQGASTHFKFRGQTFAVHVHRTS